MNDTTNNIHATDKKTTTSMDTQISSQALSDDERRELEALRAEKAARIMREERRELEELRAEKSKAASQDTTRSRASRTDAVSASAHPASHAHTTRARNAHDLHMAEIRAKNAKLMEPDEDLRMPLAQKIVLLGLFVLVVGIILVMQLGGK